MLEWIGVVCVLVLMATVWPVVKYFGTENQSRSLVRELGVPRRESKKCGARCTSDRGSGDGELDGPGESPAVAMICKPSALANYLLKHCRSFCKNASASAWDWRASPYLQTVFGVFWPHDSAVHFMRDYLQLSDDGLVALDWAAVGAPHHKRRRTSSSSTNPVLLIIPNSFGKITWNVRKLCETALGHGYLPVVFNRRCQNGTPLCTLKLQEFGDPTDLREAVRYIRYRRPAGRLYAVGESTGSGLLLAYLGECGSSSYITAAACLSPVFRCQSWFESGPAGLLHRALLLYQKFCLSRYRTVLREVVHADSLFSCSSLRAMEETLFCQSGPKGLPAEGAWESYWERNDPLRDVDEVAIPVLCVCSRDDPVRGDPRTTLPLELFEDNPHFFLLLSSRGGHCGFAALEEGPVVWSHRALLEFFRATSDFFAAEERSKQTARRRGLGGAGRAFRHRSVSTCKKIPVCSHNIHDIYNWQRSYTR
ncbi:protein ABHD15 [Brachyhypopomus gauderio]|uniref:protein ABHD15 n=1 Tax=Brachyhypopomus gauderio TaxID=698409 RepID=UPI00404387DD